MCLLCILILSPPPTAAQTDYDGLSGFKVGVYNGTGEMDSSRIALVCMFEWMNASVEEIKRSKEYSQVLPISF